MYKNRWHFLISRMFNVAVVLSLMLAGVGASDFTWVSAQEPASTPNQPGIRPLAADGSLYYYADGERLPLQVSLDWVSVKFVSDDPIAQTAALAASGAPVDLLEKPRTIPDMPLTLYHLRSGVTTGDVVQGINAMRARPNSFQAADPVFQTPDAPMAITDEFIATFPASMTRGDIAALNAAHGVELGDPLLGQPNTYVLKVRANSRLDALAMANLYQESGLAVDAAPNFVRLLKPQPDQSEVRESTALEPMAAASDPLYSDQWSLNNTQQYGTGMKADADIDAPEAWGVTTGSSAITIAVIDEGVELTQEDLVGKLVTGYDATGGGSAGAPCTTPCVSWYDDPHGTNVAGLAAAKANNSKGIAGVCPQCMIMPIRFAYEDSFGNLVTTDAKIANGISWAYLNGADILNNSWGWTGAYSSTAINTAISNARTLGRGGKGSVVLFAAGNENKSTVSYPASLSTVIAVGASNMCDRRKAPVNDLCNDYETWWGSNYGSALDVSAPGVRLDSTDRMGIYGYSQNNYFGSMNGTSGATPIVSGVAGLMLSVNPNLTSDQVQYLLQISADDANGGGWDSQMGYGRVNANRAVLVAKSSNVGPLSNGSADGWLLQSSEGSVGAGSRNPAGGKFVLGDDALNRQYRSILSFDTSAVPVGATITGVTLKIKYAGTTGTSPFSSLGKIVADIKTGSFGTASLQLGDFQAAASSAAALTIPNKAASGWYTGILPPSQYGYINKGGITQFRLRFQMSDNNNHVADYMSFYSGNYANVALRPVLTIYYLP